MVPHIPVLEQEVIDTFKDIEGIVADCTLGFGGHSSALLKSNPNISICGLDQDSEALAFSQKRLEPFKERVSLHKTNFRDIDAHVDISSLSGMLADIGVSSLQMDAPSRGFGFNSPVLDMRMDADAQLGAKEVINSYPKDALERIFRDYGEIRSYKKLADRIVARRKERRFVSAKELAEFCAGILPKTKSIHPATLPFQAIRIEVNSELEVLETLLQKAEGMQEGIVAIISFHSLEDRIIKQRFKEWAKECICPPEVMRCECGGKNAKGKIVTKKPITATKEEIAKNPRSRSAKLRVFEFISRTEAQ